LEKTGKDLKEYVWSTFLLRFFFYVESERRGAEGGVVKNWVIFEIYVF